MATKPSLALRNNLLQGSSLKASLDGGFIYIFAGAEPADADAALDMTATSGVHTLLAKIAADATPVANGVTGLTLAAAAANGAITKLSTQTWAAVIDFVGKDAAQAGVGPLTATFFRFCSATDNGQAAGTVSTPRLQGSVATSGAEANLTSVSLSDNGTNTVGLATFEVRAPAA